MHRKPSLRPVLLLAFILASIVVARAAPPPPVVIAVDATLDPDSRAEADSSIAALMRALPEESEIGLVVFDEVVRRVVPLSAAGTEQRQEIAKALRTPDDPGTSNLVAGLERGIDELDDRGAAHLLVFANARITGADDESIARFRDWYREILLPDAAARDIAVTLVSPAAGADAVLLAELTAHPTNTSHLLDGETDITGALLRRVPGGPRGAAELSAGDPSGGIADTPPDTVATGASTPSLDRRLLSWYVVAAWAFAMAALLLFAVLRRRRSSVRRASDRSTTGAGGTSSAYLPLHTSDPRHTPTRRPMPSPPGSAVATTARRDAPEPTPGRASGQLRGQAPERLAERAAATESATERTRIGERDDTQATRLAPGTRAGARGSVTAAAGETPPDGSPPDGEASASEVDELDLLETITAERTGKDPLD